MNFRALRKFTLDELIYLRLYVASKEEQAKLDDLIEKKIGVDIRAMARKIIREELKKAGTKEKP
jgi:hypothetical protein